MLKRVLLTLITGFALAFTAISFAGNSPTDVVRTSVDAVLAILDNEQLNYDDKRTQIRFIDKERFDFRAISLRSLATNWMKTSDEE